MAEKEGEDRNQTAGNVKEAGPDHALRLKAGGGALASARWQRPWEAFEFHRFPSV